MERRFIRAFLFIAAGFLLFLPSQTQAQNAWIFAKPGECEFRFQMPEQPDIQETAVETQDGVKKTPLYWYTQTTQTAQGEATIAVQAFCFQDHPIRLMRLQKEDLIKMLERNARDLKFLHKETYFKEFPEQDYTQATLTGFLRITEESPLIHLSNVYVGKSSVLLISGDVIGADSPLEDVFREIMDSPKKYY